MAGEQQEIPLFPLNVVLFPGMALPLHIFEERYKEMVGRCLEADEGFGVVLISEGRDVGDPATPFEIGTVARIASVERLPDGRLNLVTVGTRRFRCLEHVQVVPYRIARVEWLDYPPAGGACKDLADEVRRAAEDYLKAVYALADRARRAVELADEPTMLSFQVGAVLQQIAPEERQRLLAADATEPRLRQELTYLRRETRLLQLLLSRRDRGNAGSFSRN